MGAPVRCRADPGILGQDRPPPAQPRRRPPGQPRAVADRVHPPWLPPGHPRLRRTAHERGKVQGRDHPLPHALPRPPGLPPPPRAAGLSAAHHVWLARAASVPTPLHAGPRPDGPRYAWIDWESAVTALDARQLACTGSEAAILRIAASLGDPATPVHLARVLGSLDHHNIQLVTAAITRANG